MFGNRFQLNRQNLEVIEEIGKHMPGGFFIYRAEAPGELLYANRAVYDIFGCENGEAFRTLTGNTFKGMLHPDDYETVSKSIEEQVEGDEARMDHTEYRIVRRDGAVRWVDDYGHYTHTEAYGGIYYVFITDITEQRERMETHRAQLDNMITAMASDYRSVYHVDLDNDEAICYRADPNDPDDYREGMRFPFHASFAEYGEKYVDEQYKEGFRRFIDPERIRQALSTESIIAYRYLAHRNGADYYEMLRMAGVRHPADRDDHIVHAVGIGFTVIDAEMRESLEQRRVLVEALDAARQANSAKTAFLSSMSHEIRTPMNAIIGLNSLAMKDEALSPQTREYLRKAGESARHLLDLINDILDMSRIESGRMVLRSEMFSFSAILEQINTMVMSQCGDKGLRYDCRVLSSVDDYYIGDEMKLKEVLLNILSNAVKFTDAPGEIALTVERTAVFADQSTMKFCIRDTGIGMDPAFIPRIFDPFSQEDGSRKSKYGSTGLGMAITKNIVEMMNGTIEVESEKGVGTKFTVIVSLRNCEQPTGNREIDPASLKVLVVDDDPITAEHARTVLEEVGIRTDVCHDGPTALGMLELQHAKQTPYNLVLMDWSMPGMDGLEAARLVRERYDDETAVIMLTACNWDDIAQESAVDSFLAKPLFASDVLSELERVARRSNTNLFKEKRRAALGGRRVLLAEDMEINAELMTDILSLEEVQVDHAENGEIALRMFGESPVGAYSAILMDVRMPVMDGLEAAAAIRTLSRPDAGSIPIIALTANAFDEDVQRSLQAGMNAHLTKPVEAENLFQTLGELIYEAENGKP